MKSKNLIRFLLVLFAFGFSTQNVEAQFWKKIKKHAEEKIKREAERRTERRVDKGIDKTFDKAEDVIDGKGQKKKKSTKKKSANDNEEANSQEENTQNQDGQQANETSKKKYTPKVVWSKFDFVPGDEVIFEDAPSPMEENGEFPSRWDLVEGNAEIAEVDGEPVIYLKEGDKSEIIPYMKNRKEDYLPDVFTIEFDYYIPESHKGNARGMEFYLYDRKNQKNIGHYFVLGQNAISSRSDIRAEGSYPGTSDWNDATGKWRHLSLAYTKGKLKVYLDDTRLINIPHFEQNPTGLTIARQYGHDNTTQKYFIKNIRIAKGGVKYYDRVMQDGKIIANGIRFDVGKTSLKPESMGVINKIYKLMSKKPDLKFSVEGHTDSDGDDISNQTLSEGRAKVVMEKLVEMGISKDRLSSKGWGESKPIAGNDTPEGKANNRRVEFVLIK